MTKVDLKYTPADYTKYVDLFFPALAMCLCIIVLAYMTIFSRNIFR